MASIASDNFHLPRPTPVQLAWQDMEVGMFFHFDIVTYVPDWDFRSWRNLPDPGIYNPVKLETDQWMEAAKAIGARYAVFVAKHCSGFLQWQSDIYPYGVKQSRWRNGKGDVVKDFVESCHKYGIKPGIYASVSANGYLEVDNPGLVNRGRGGDTEKQSEYARICEQMLTELWSRYGELTEIWFDGGALPPEEGGPDMVPLLKRLQPNAIVFQGPVASIRWIGNERGQADYPCWATVPSLEALSDRQILLQGDPDGKLWLPGECDVPIRNHQWFWKPDQDNIVYSLDELMDMYYKSVGRNCNLLLNANPNQGGLIPDADFKRYVEFGNEIRRRFSKPLAEVEGEGDLVEMELDHPTTIDHAIIMEDIIHGERIREYVIEGQVENADWQILCRGMSIGHKRIEKFDPVKVSGVRLRCTRSAAVPLVRRLAVYSAGAN
jgi:alpha-L-fucosidase